MILNDGRGMVAGGTGITPMLQVIKAVAAERENGNESESEGARRAVGGGVEEIRLVFANKSPEDILLRGEIEALARRHPDLLKVWYTVDSAQGDAQWAYSTGFVNEEMLRAHLPPPGEDTVCFMCGPKPMIERAVLPSLEKIGHDACRVFAF